MGKPYTGVFFSFDVLGVFLDCSGLFWCFLVCSGGLRRICRYETHMRTVLDDSKAEYPSIVFS